MRWPASCSNPLQPPSKVCFRQGLLQIYPNIELCEAYLVTRREQGWFWSFSVATQTHPGYGCTSHRCLKEQRTCLPAFTWTSCYQWMYSVPTYAFLQTLAFFLEKAIAIETYDSLLWGGYYYEVFKYPSRNKLSSLKLKQLLCFWDGITLVSEAYYNSDTFDWWNALQVDSKGNFLYSFVEVVFTYTVAGGMGRMLKHFCTVLKGKSFKSSKRVSWCAGYSRIMGVGAKLSPVWYLAGRCCAVANKS